MACDVLLDFAKCVYVCVCLLSCGFHEDNESYAHFHLMCTVQKWHFANCHLEKTFATWFVIMPTMVQFEFTVHVCTLIGMTVMLTSFSPLLQ